MPTTASTPWRDANLVALDLEGSGAQDRDDEAILEIAAVPLATGTPAAGAAFCSLVYPGRKIRQGPWISPGLTNAVLADAPALAEIESQLVRLLNDTIIVGHNVGVDWRLLRRRCPLIKPGGLIDTLRLAKHLRPHDESRSLTKLVDQLGLRDDISRLASDSDPHRALWDAMAAGALLEALLSTADQEDMPLAQLLNIAGLPLDAPTPPMRLL